MPSATATASGVGAQAGHRPNATRGGTRDWVGPTVTTGPRRRARRERARAVARLSTVDQDEWTGGYRPDVAGATGLSILVLGTALGREPRLAWPGRGRAARGSPATG